MKPTQIYTFDVPADGAFNLKVAGEYFKILSSTGALNVRAEWGRLNGIVAGQGLEDSPFSGLELFDASGSVNSVRILIGDEKFIDGLGGAVAVTQNAPARSSGFTSAAVNVTNASAQILAANTGRQYLLVQNNHASASVFLNFGAAATLAGCIKVIPGGAFELGAGVVCTQAIHAIGDTALNANVVVVGG